VREHMIRIKISHRCITIMPKRRRSNSTEDSHESSMHAMIQSSKKKAKSHYLYDYMHHVYTVADLKSLVRGYGQKGWYNMKKQNLVVTVVINMAAASIVYFFRQIVNKARNKVISSAASSPEDVCPISLTPVSELVYPYVHDRVVFSREHLVSFFMSSYNFTNPITRREFTRREIRRFGSPTLCTVFDNRHSLRADAIYEIQHFAFLETEMENYLKRMMYILDHGDQDLFNELGMALDNTFDEMIHIDRNRTRCILKSMFDFIENYNERRKDWAKRTVNEFIYQCDNHDC